MYATIPNLNRARHPLWAMQVFDLCLTVLLACGLDALPTSAIRGRLMRFLATFGVLGYGVLTVIGITDTMKAESIVWMAPLVALLLAGLLWAMSRGLSRVTGVVAVGILLTVELGASSAWLIVDLSDKNRTQYLDRMKSNEDIGAFLKNQAGGPFRIRTDGKELPDNWSELFGLETTSGYIGAVTNNIVNLDMSQPYSQQLLGVRYRVSRDPRPLPDVEVFQGKSGLRVYRDDTAFPRAWFARASAPVPPGSKKAAILRIDPAQFRNVASTQGDFPSTPECSGDDEVRYVSHAPAESELQVATPCDRILVISETWFPGWEGRIDGRPAIVHEVDGALQGLLVPTGKHVINLRYRPLSVFAGAWITMLSAAAAVFFQVRTRPGTEHCLPGQEALN